MARRQISFLDLSALLISALAFISCASSEDDNTVECPDPNLDITVCDPAAGLFSSTSDNEFFPFQVGTKLVLEGDDEGVIIRVEIEALDQTEDVAGVTTRVVTETESEDGEIVEISRNWYAQAPDGTVCYFGESVDIYEGGEVTGHSGSWRAGENDYQAGIIMPGDPQVGQVFYQEYAPGLAEDMSEIKAFGESITVPAGTFDDTLSASDYDPFDGCGESDRKVYVRGIGLAIDEVSELISY